MRPTRALAALTLLPLALAGCGSSGGTGGATSGPSSAATSSAKAADNAYSMCEKEGDLDKNTFLETNKKAQGDLKTLHMDLAMEKSGTAATTGAASGTASASASSAAGEPIGSGDVDASDPANPKMKMTMTSGATGASGEMVLVGQDLYVSGGAATGNKFVKMSASQLGIDLNSLRNPADQFEKQKDAIQSIRCLGRQDVNGTKTAHLRVVVDPTKAAAASGQSVPASAASAMPASVDTDMWVDEKGRPVKTTTNVGAATMVVTYSKFNEPVTVTVPPATQVTTVPGMPGATPTVG